MSFKDDLTNEFNAILKQRDSVVKAYALEMYSSVVQSSPVDSGNLRQAWQLPQQIPNGWAIRNAINYAYIIDGGRRQVPINGGMKWVGSEQLPDGWNPIVRTVEKSLNQALKAIR